MDDEIKYNDFLDEIAENALYSLESSDLPFDLEGRKLKTVLITYVFDDFSVETTQIGF